MSLQQERDLHAGLACLSLSSNATSLDDIPVEIMRQIFEYCVARQGRMPRSQKTEYPRTLVDPFTLCLVCVAWRNIAIDHPPLWSEVALRGESTRPPFASLVCKVSRGQTSSFRARLARVRAFPWSLRIQISPLATLIPILDHSAPHSHVPLSQFMSFENRAQSFANLRRLRISGPARLAGLQDLDLRNLEVFIMERNSDRYEFPQGALPSLPRLTKFAAIDIAINMFPSPVPWSGLTHLHLEAEMCHADLVFILQNSLDLQAAYVRFCEPIISTPDQALAHSLRPIEGTVSLTKLKCMSFSGMTPFHGDLTGLFWPSLTHFRLAAMTGAWTPANLQKLGPLTHLELSCRKMGPRLTPLMQIIDACPLLVRLVLNISASIDHRPMFRALTFDSSRRELKHLEELGISCTVRREPGWGWEVNNSTSSAYSSLEDLVDSRTREHAAPCARLKSLAIRISQGREYNPAAKRVEEVLRSFEGRLAKWNVIRGSGINSPFDGIFDESWGDGGLEELLDW